MSSVHPQEVDVYKEKNITHDSPTCQESTIEESMKAYDICCDREDKECCEGFTTWPETDQSEEACDRHSCYDVGVHQCLDKLKSKRIGIHISCWSWEEIERAKYWHDEQESHENLESDMTVFFHRIKLRMNFWHTKLYDFFCKREWEFLTVRKLNCSFTGWVAGELFLKMYYWPRCWIKSDMFFCISEIHERFSAVFKSRHTIADIFFSLGGCFSNSLSDFLETCSVFCRLSSDIVIDIFVGFHGLIIAKYTR